MSVHKWARAIPHSGYKYTNMSGVHVAHFGIILSHDGATPTRTLFTMFLGLYRTIQRVFKNMVFKYMVFKNMVFLEKVVFW